MHTPRWADFKSPARRCSGALLLLAIAGLLIAACGGGGGGGGGGADCSTRPKPPGPGWGPGADPAMLLAGYRIYFRTEQGTYSGVGACVGTGTTITRPVRS